MAPRSRSVGHACVHRVIMVTRGPRRQCIERTESESDGRSLTACHRGKKAFHFSRRFSDRGRIFLFSIRNEHSLSFRRSRLVGGRTRIRRREGTCRCVYTRGPAQVSAARQKRIRIAKAANIAKFSHHPASYLLSLRLFPRLLSPAG